MSRSRKLLIAAIVGLAILDPISQNGRAQEATANRPEPQKAEQKPVDLRPIQDALNGLTGAVKALKDNPEAENENERAQRDLQAQQDMAKWAEKLFWATVASLLLTLAGIFLIWRTLVHTRRAANASDQMATQTVVATNAAVEAAKAANLTAKAMLGIESPIIRPTRVYSSLLQPSGPDADPVLEVKIITFRNFGRTPAFPRMFFAGVAIDSGRPQSTPLTEIDIFPGNAIIEPEPQEKAFEAAVTIKWQIDPEQMVGVDGGLKDIWLEGVLFYVDFLDNMQTLKLTWKLGTRNGIRSFILDSCRVEAVTHISGNDQNGEGAETVS
jgi:hypothetical protein